MTATGVLGAAVRLELPDGTSVRRAWHPQVLTERLGPEPAP